MEPDFDKMVSNKIRQTEQQPVSWNKQAVWQKLQSETNATRHHYFYYVAAAMILLLIYFAVGPIPNEIKPQVTDAKVKSGQEATASERLVVPEKNQNLAPDPPVNDRENTTTNAAVTEITNNTREVTKPAQHETKNVDADAVIEPLLTDIKIRAEEFLLPEEMMVPEQKIRPIVGVITESYSENVANVKQKKPLRKLASPDPVPWEDPANALVFAVRK